jgi:hypothetical protein
MSEHFIYKIVDNDTGEFSGSYSRSCHTDYEFSSVRSARDSNVHGVFYDKRKYRIQKWKVTYELIEDDIDPYVQTSIPMYKDYLARKTLRDMFMADMRRAFSGR